MSKTAIMLRIIVKKNEFDKECSVTMSDALLSPKSIELVTGVATKVGIQAISMRQDTEYDVTDPINPVDKGSYFPLKASGTGAIQLAHTPLESAANIWVYKKSEDGMTGKEKVGTLAGTVLTVAELSNQEVVVYYSYNSKATAEVYTVAADKFGGTYKMVGNTYLRNESTGADEKFQMVIPKAKLKSGFSLNFSSDGEPSVFDMSVEILKDSKTPTMISMIKY